MSSAGARADLGFRPGAGVSGVLAAVALLLVFAFSPSWVRTVVLAMSAALVAVFGPLTMAMYRRAR